MKNSKKWLTFVELVIVVWILVTISTISFVNYVWYLSDSRNAVRVSDMSSLKISLNSHKIKNSIYPNPWNFFVVNNYWIPIIKQWKVDNQLFSLEIAKKPLDPLTKSNYFYSVLYNNLFYQISMSFEDSNLSNWLKAFVDGDYQQIADFAPSISFAVSSTGDILSYSWKFILNNWIYNLPYNKNWNIYSENKNFNENISQSSLDFPKFYWYYSCQEISDNNSYIWSWTYKILNSSWTVFSTWCNF